jgi:hypothetical protein
MRASAHAHLRLIVSEPAASPSTPAAVEAAGTSRSSSPSYNLDTGRISMVQPVSTFEVWARRRRRDAASLWLASAVLLIVAVTLLVLNA